MICSWTRYRQRSPRVVAEEPDVVDDRGGSRPCRSRTGRWHFIDIGDVFVRPSPAKSARSFCRSSSSSRSSASSQKIQSPVAWRSDSLRAAAKSSTQGNSKTRAPRRAAIARVRSVEPVSTTIISSTRPAAGAEALGQIRLFVLDDHAERDARAWRQAGPRRRVGEAIAGRALRAPFLAEPGEVLFELSAAVDPQRGERPAAEVVDEHVECQQQMKAGLASADAQVVVVEEAQAEALVEAADAVEDLAADQQAEAGEPLDADRPAGEFAAPPRGERFQPVQGTAGRNRTSICWGGAAALLTAPTRPTFGQSWSDQAIRPSSQPSVTTVSLLSSTT